MPTERFNHLPEEKKRLIWEAAIQEFSRVSMEKVSINRIVKSADISRGSFYTYFQDKEDLLQYIFEDFVEQVQLFCQETILLEKGDFWKLPEKLLEYVLAICDKNKMITLAQNALGHQTVMKMLENKVGFCALAQEAKSKWLLEVYHATNCQELCVENFEDYQILFSLCTSSMIETLGEIYRGGAVREKAMASFRKRINFIKYGAIRKRFS